MVDFQQLDQEDPPHLIFNGRPADDDFGYSRPPIPTVMKLEGEDNFMKWREAVRNCFTEFGLTHFIDNTDAIPAADTTNKVRLQYVRDRSMAYQVLRSSASPVMDILFRFGWKDGKDKPQLLYDTIVQAIWVNDTSWYPVACDLMSLKAANFDTLRDFLKHYFNCIAKLQDIGIEYQDRAKMAIILKALEGHDYFWANNPVCDMEIGGLTYGTLMPWVIRKANHESFYGLLAAGFPVGGQQLVRPVNHSQGSNNTGNAVRVYCKDPACEKLYPTMPKHGSHTLPLDELFVKFRSSGRSA